MKTTPSPEELSTAIREVSKQVGFDLCGIAPAVTPTGYSRLLEWVEAGHAGEMSYIERRLEAYQHPRGVMRDVRSLVVLAARYAGRNASTGVPPAPSVARYAQGTHDYHDVLREKMGEVADVVHHLVPGARTRLVVDTAPLLERDFARTAGLGWFGKNTMLINRWQGSQFFLCAILTDQELAADLPHDTAHCGTCTRCLDACPTDAFPDPGVLDASRCISYLTIELRDQSIPESLRSSLGEWVFGCDICQDVCPWNRHAAEPGFAEFQPRAEWERLDLEWLLSLTPSGFRTAFDGTPMQRPGRSGMLRNALLVAANLNRTDLVPLAVRLLDDPDPMVRGAAVWSLSVLGDRTCLGPLNSRLQVENNDEVQQEIQRAIERFGGRDS